MLLEFLKIAVLLNTFKNLLAEFMATTLSIESSNTHTEHPYKIDFKNKCLENFQRV